MRARVCGLCSAPALRSAPATARELKVLCTALELTLRAGFAACSVLELRLRSGLRLCTAWEFTLLEPALCTVLPPVPGFAKRVTLRFCPAACPIVMCPTPP